jgi:hypothetical protein
LSHLYSASNHNRIIIKQLCLCELLALSRRIRRRLNLSLAMMRENMTLTLAGSIGEQLLFSNFGQAQPAPIRFSHESVNHIV